MSGTIEGGKKAARTMKDRYGENVYKVMGALGGASSFTGGFFANRELARTAGRIGGSRKRSKR